MLISRLHHTVLALSLISAAGFAAISITPAVHAQSQISGDVAGTVTDPSGAVVPNAQITVTNAQTGLSKTTTSSAAGAYRIALLPAGTYKVTATATGFQTSSFNVTISTASVATGDVKLTVGQGTQTIEVTEEAPLLQTENSQLSTNFTEQQIQTIPNPGNDITYYAQTSPGVVMNTGGGYGNFSVFGLPGTSNNFTLNGAQVNDPFLNLNNSGPSNLLLGQNDVAEVAVVANAYDAAFGSFGGVQLNETTRTGTNKLHGNATWWYNGALFNANNWFANQAGTPKPNTVNNQWAAGIGGPLIKDKTFWFADWEAIRFVTSSPSRVSIPSPAYQTATLDTLAQGGAYGDPGSAAQIPYYNYMFGLYNNAAQGYTLQPDPDNADAVFFESTPKTSLREGLIAARIDQNVSQNDHVFVHAEYDVGRQPTYTDPLYSAWNATSYQPAWTGQMAWFHTFSPNVTNQFLMTGAHYEAIFQLSNYQAAQALLPFSLVWADENFASLNYLNYDFPQGRNATQYQFADDFSVTKGRHTIKAGLIFKRDDISNFDLGIYNNPLVEGFGQLGGDCLYYDAATASWVGDPNNTLDYYCLTSGYFYINRQIFPKGQNLSAVGGSASGVAPHVPIAFYNLGPYVEDVFKPTPRLTLTAGVRFEHNSNPVCQSNCFSRLNTGFWDIAGNDSVDTPYNSILGTGYHQAFNRLQSYIPEPRIGVNYAINDKTVIRAGFGMFADVFPAQVTDYLARNAPLNPRFQATGASGGNLIYFAPTVPGNGFELNQTSNATFFGPNGYAAGGSYASMSTASAGGFSRPNIYTSETSIKYPSYEEWSLQIQRQIGRSGAFQVGYVGNHQYHEPVVNTSANAYSLGAPVGFGLPASRPAASFGEVVNIQSNASGNFNGLIASYQHRAKWMSAQINWSWGHALDMISNGGFLGFTGSSLTGQIDPRNIRYNYGNADYDTRHNINGNYLINVPNAHSIKLLTNDWTVAGTVFFRTGFPFTVTDGVTSANSMGNYYAAIPAAYAVSSKSIPHHCGKEGVTSDGGCFKDFAGGPQTPYFAYAGTFHDQERNQFTGPNFFDTDISLLKGIKMPWEGGLLQIGVQAFNVLNHPNFANPGFDIADSTAGFGHITATVGPPTSIYGSGLGGDASVRILQFKANLRF
ncbi:MAG TPA: TonB-dependent receptor [Terracidiphilus sp.]